MVVYEPSATMNHFHEDNSFVRALMGPIGSGKSVACCIELMAKATAQDADQNGLRRTRWAIIRNTYRELVDTTMETFFDWFPRKLGVWRAQDMKWTLEKPLPDGTRIHAEFIFRALDRPNDIRKLLSLELTGGWLNECREIPKAVLDMLQGRVGRYPPKKDGTPPTWFGIIADTNPPDSDHWWYHLFEEQKPEGFSIYKQPSAKSPLAENIANLPDNYYVNMVHGKDKEWINVYVHGKYGFIADGKPVYPEYKDDVHCSPEEIIHVGTDDVRPIFVGIDFGLTPAAVFGQLTASGQMRIIDELATFDMGAVNFAKLLSEKIQREYCGCHIEFIGDPAGEDRVQTDKETPFMVLWANGIDAYPAYTNDWTIRREAVADYLQRLDFTGQPAFQICPIKAPLTRKALAGGYKLRRLQVAGAERYEDKPDKRSRYSHVGDAVQYMFLGAVGGDRVLGTGGIRGMDIDYSHINRKIA